MRAAALIAMLSTTAFAGPAIAPKKEPPTPPRVRELAHKLFEEAAAAAAAGQLDVAIARYHELDRLAPHAHVAFNLAQVYEAKGDLAHAIEHYDRYLAAETGDTKTAKHAAELRATPGQVEFVAKTTLGVKAVWFVDGDLVARNSQTAPVPPGRHRIDMVSELGHEWRRATIKPGKSRGDAIEAPADEREDGNVVLASTIEDGSAWVYEIDGSDRDDAIGKGVHYSGRYTIPPGNHAVKLVDTVCTYATTVSIKRDELVYFYFDRKNFDHRKVLDDMRPTNPACGQLVVKRHAIEFK